MKILVVDRQLGQPLDEFPHVELIADSALVLQGKPVFLPLDPSDFKVEIVPAFRIGHLGKSIPEKFAYRYRDAFTLAGRVLAPDNLHGALATSFDSAFQPGTWIETQLAEKAEIIINNALSFELSAENLLIDRTIAVISRYMTLKTGDIIVPCSLSGALFPAVVDSSLTASVDSFETIHLRMK